MAQAALLHGSSDSIINTADLARLLLDTNNPLPQRFIIPESERPNLSDNIYRDSTTLPTIDLSNFDDSSERLQLAPLLAQACTQWGFFQVVNHGIPVELLCKAKEVGFSLFSLPTEVKERCAFGITKGYEGRFPYVEKGAPWLEAFTFEALPNMGVEEVAGRLWHEGNQEFCDSIREITNLLADLARKITVLLAESLGLESNTFAQHFTEPKGRLRFNHYPPCPQPALTFGANAHTDPNMLTILYQDEVGGLQIRGRDDKWVGVKPCKEALVINIGDSFQAWINSRYLSVEHRVLVNPTRARLSFGLFLGPPEDVVIQAPRELVDDEHPQQYKPFTWAEYLEWRKKPECRGVGRTAFKRFAGIDNP